MGVTLGINYLRSNYRARRFLISFERIMGINISAFLLLICFVSMPSRVSVRYIPHIYGIYDKDISHQ